MAQVFRETLRLLKSHYDYVPFQWVYGYWCYLVDRRDQFYEPLEPSFFKYFVSLPVGCWHNRKQISRYVREWLAVMSIPGQNELLAGPCLHQRGRGNQPSSMGHTRCFKAKRFTMCLGSKG